MTDQVTTPEGGALPSKGANPSFAAAKAEAVEAEAKAKPKEVAADSPPAADPSEKPAKPAKTGEQVRIDELTRKYREEQRRSDRLMKAHEELLTRINSQQQQPPAQPATEKTLKDFNYDDGAYAKYLREQVATEARTQVKSVVQQEREALEFQQRLNAHDARVAKFRAEVEDFDVEDARAGMTFVHKDMADAILDSDESAAVEYYLYKNQDEAREIAAMTPARAGRAIERIEQRIVTERKKALEKPVSQAPPPPPKIEGADPGNVEKDPSKMTDAQFRKWREKTIASRR